MYAHQTRTVKCPVCNTGKLVNAAKHIAPSQIRIYPPPKYKTADYFVKCPKCKKQIGISIK